MDVNVDVEIDKDELTALVGPFSKMLLRCGVLWRSTRGRFS